MNAGYTEELTEVQGNALTRYNFMHDLRPVDTAD